MTREEKIALIWQFVKFEERCDRERIGRVSARSIAPEFCAALTDDPAPTAPGDPKALELADTSRHNWTTDDECYVAAILRRAPKQEDVPGSPRALELPQYVGHLNVLNTLQNMRSYHEKQARGAAYEWHSYAQTVLGEVIAAILRRAPKREDVPGDPEAAELAEWLEWCADVSTKAFAERALKASAILRRAPRADIDALEKAMREAVVTATGGYMTPGQLERLEAAIAKMRREAGGEDK